MHPIIYDVAVSLDGFISGPNEDLTAYPSSGPLVDDYFARVGTYRTVIMGRSTYEFGKRFGMALGANPYPQARTIVVSRTLELPTGSQVELRASIDAAALDALRSESTGPVYLCGGGRFAAHLLNLGQIDILRLKRAPILVGSGVPLFDGAERPPRLTLLNQRDYGGGLLFQEFRTLS